MREEKKNIGTIFQYNLPLDSCLITECMYFNYLDNNAFIVSSAVVVKKKMRSSILESNGL